MNRLFCKSTSLSLLSVLCLVLLPALFPSSVAFAQVGADFAGGKEKLEQGAVVVYALLTVLLVMSFAIAVAHYVRRKAFDDETNGEPEDYR